MLRATAIALFGALLAPWAVSAATPSPAPSATPRVLKTIVTVISSPYCNALARHFNGALLPMLANDRIFNGVNVQLLDMNEMFKYPNYADRFLVLRGQIVKEAGVLMASLNPMRQQIDLLREAATLSSDPAAVQQMRDAAEQLQQAYDHQFQLSTDLTSLGHSMMEYDVFDKDHPIYGWTQEEQAMPADEKNVKVYLHFDKQRTSIDDAESHAVDVAYAIAQDRCTKLPSPSPTR